MHNEAGLRKHPKSEDKMLLDAFWRICSRKLHIVGMHMIKLARKVLWVHVIYLFVFKLHGPMPINP